jgi:hypothetical protein
MWTMRTMRVMLRRQQQQQRPERPERQRRRPVLDVAVADFVSAPAAASAADPKYVNNVIGVELWAWWKHVCELSGPPRRRAAGTHLAVGVSACWARACGAQWRIYIPARARDTAGMSDARRSTE